MSRFAYRVSPAAGVMILLFFLFFPVSIPAAPVEVTFFPNTARVKEITPVRLQNATGGLKKTVFVLPGQADPETLISRGADSARIVIEDQTWRQVSRQDDGAIMTLRKKMEDLKEERMKIISSIKALETQMQFWQMQTKAKVKTLADAANLSAALGKNMKKTMVEKLALEPVLEKLDKQIRQLQEDLNAAGGRKETVWEVTALLSGAPGSDTVLIYTYHLAGCGWTPLYRLEAQPLDKRIRFSWEGEIWQSSGQDWSQVTVHLANLQPRSVLQPPTIPTWIIKPRPAPVVFSKKAKTLRAAETLAATDAGSPAGAATAPALESGGTYTSWNVGKRFLAAGARQRIKIAEESWPAEFLHLCRPSQSEQVFVQAVVKFDDVREIPRGHAVILLDGAMIGKRSFAAGSREETIFFGADPLFKAKTTLLAQKSGEKTLFQDKQTYTWNWRIDLENNRAYAVRMRVEEPIPQSRDERISISLTHDPQPTEKADTLQAWIVQIPALGKQTILTGVSVEAPKDIPLDLGWRR